MMHGLGFSEDSPQFRLNPNCCGLVKSKGFEHQMILHRMFFVLSAMWTIHTNPGKESEHFKEVSVIHPLKDGQITTRFSFTRTL